MERKFGWKFKFAGCCRILDFCKLLCDLQCDYFPNYRSVTGGDFSCNLQLETPWRSASCKQCAIFRGNLSRNDFARPVARTISDSVTYLAMTKSIARQVAAIVAESKIEFYFLQQLISALHSVTPPQSVTCLAIFFFGNSKFVFAREILQYDPDFCGQTLRDEKPNIA